MVDAQSLARSRAFTGASAPARILLVAILGAAPCACGAAATPPAPTAPTAAPTPAPPVAAVPDEQRPQLRLPTDVQPSAEAIELKIAPEDARFSGKVDIDVALSQPRQSLWLHSHGLHVSAATVTPDGAAPIAAAWSDEDDEGLGRLVLAAPAPAGHARVHMEFDAPFTAGTRGLFKTKDAGTSYAFTQFESVDARRAFPCFDEPSFKIPFTVTLDVPTGDQAITNTPETNREAPDQGLVRVHFAQTKPLPSYLVAFAVGPLDVVTAPNVPPNAARSAPLPLRGIAVHGRGGDLAYAMAHAGEILSALEGYFGIAYPYDKMDIIAVPDMGGAMENAGAVTFSQELLLFDPKTAPLRQRQDFAMVVAHEFSHQWFGDLVTMAWWDDTWLNEAFAEWMGFKIADRWDPTLREDLEFAEAIQHAMDLDSLVSARQIHQPIVTTDDIENAFDDTTYDKGGAVIAMFDRWLGADVLQKGVRQHLTQHRFGNATADDFLSALSAAAGKDVATPFRSFLDQPGVPYIEASVQCGGGAPRVHLRQSRFLPQGSTGDANKLWQVPVCARYHAAGGKDRESCTLLTAAEGDLPLEGGACPTWVFPNARGAGYYRFSLASPDLAHLRLKGVGALDARERLAFGNSLKAALSHGSTPFAEVLDAAATLANDTDRHVAREPASLVRAARDWLFADPVRPAIEAYARKLMGRQAARLGWTRKAGEPDSTMQLRAQVLSFMADVGRDPGVRAEAKRRALAYIGFGKDGALHPEAVDQNLVGTALGIAAEDADGPLFDAMLKLYTESRDDEVRRNLLRALGLARDPALAARALALSLDDRVKYTEMFAPLSAQMSNEETRDRAWQWIVDHWDALAARSAGSMFTGIQLVSMPSSFCDEDHAKQAADFLKDRATKLDGGPRALAKTLEDIHLCAAERSAQQDSARRAFAHP